MRIVWNLIGVLAVAGVLGASFFSAGAPGAQAASSFADIEPNDSCATAQVLGALHTPLTLSGSLDGLSGPYPYPYPTPSITATSTPQPAATFTPQPAAASARRRTPTATARPITATPTQTQVTVTPTPSSPPTETPNIDFFRVTAAPDSFLKISMAGLSSDKGTLADPMVGAFTGNCGAIGAADYGGVGLDAQLVARVPADGELIIAATSCCDYGFTRGGPGAGTYTLTVEDQPVIGSIAGRLVDALTGEPVAPPASPFVSLELQQCSADDPSSCYSIWYMTVDEAGGFLLTPQDAPSPLLPGAYRLVARADGYRPLATPIVSVAGGEELNLGEIKVTKREQIRAIGGRVVDTQTGKPVEGASATLERCDLVYCSWIAVASSDADGGFSFSTDFGGGPLYNDTYQLTLSAPAYDPTTTAQFTPDAGADYSLGTIRLSPIPLIGSIGGRLVDAVTGKPLAISQIGYSQVTLQACDSWGCYNTVAYSFPGDDGSFRFDASAGQFLRAGSYAIGYFADQYISGQTDPFEVGEGANVDLGDIKVQPFPIRLIDQTSCGSIPAGGGVCRYTIRVVNSQPRSVSLRVWDTVATYNPATGFTSSFQPAEAQKVRLRPGESHVVRFTFDVPRKVAPYTDICTQVYVANDARGFYFAPINQRFGFCVVKDGAGSFKPVKGDELIELQQRMHGVPASQRNKR